MSIIFLVCTSNFKRALNDKKKFITNLLVPIAVIILAMFVNYVSSPSINIGIVKNADTQDGNRIITLLEKTKGINVKLADAKLIKTQTILGKYDGVIFINKSFDSSFDYYSVRDAKTKDMLKNIVKVYLTSDKPINMEASIIELKSGTLTKEERVISFLATILLITAVVNATVIIKDRHENTLCRFMYSPNNKYKYLLGNILYNYIFTYIQLFIAIILARILGMKLDISLFSLLGYGLLLTLLMTTLGTFIASIFNKELYANLFAAAISLILSLIGGTFIIYDKMPKGLQLLSTLTPNRWIIKSIQYLEHGTFSTVNPLIIMLVFSVAFSIGATLMNTKLRVKTTN